MKRLSRRALLGSLATLGVASAFESRGQPSNAAAAPPTGAPPPYPVVRTHVPLLPASAGPVVAMGGSVRFDNEAVWRRIVDLAGGPGARFAVFAMAAGRPEYTGDLLRRTLERVGAQAEFIPVAPGLNGQDVTAEAANPKWLEALRRADGVMFSGGAQERIAQSLQPSGQPTPLLQAIRELQARGGVVAGTSAGAAVMSSVMFKDAPFVMGVLKGRLRPGVEYDRGLGFAGPDVFVDQHFLKRGRVGRMIPLMVEAGYTLGLGVEENAAAILHRDHIEVIGHRGALIVDLSTARVLSRQPLTLQGARLSLLETGDRFHMPTRTVVPATGKRSQQPGADPPDFDPYTSSSRLFMDALGDQTVANAMAWVVDGPRSATRALAYSTFQAAWDTQPDLGFEFLFVRDDLTRAWFRPETGGDNSTLEKIRLDIRPVRVSTPLYTPWE